MVLVACNKLFLVAMETSTVNKLCSNRDSQVPWSHPPSSTNKLSATSYAFFSSHWGTSCLCTVHLYVCSMNSWYCWNLHYLEMIWCNYNRCSIVGCMCACYWRISVGWIFERLSKYQFYPNTFNSIQELVELWKEVDREVRIISLLIWVCLSPL